MRLTGYNGASWDAGQHALAMPLYTTDALVLRTHQLGEADRIVVFLTRDRGKKRGVATGARRSDIMTQFVVESLVVGGLGGIVGVLFGLGVCYLLAQSGMTIAVTALPAFLAFTSALATGLVFGLLPARQASRLDPVTALASE